MENNLFHTSATAGARRGSRFKRTWLRLGTLLGGAVLVLLVAYGYLTVHFSRTLEAEVTKLQAQGAFVTVAELLESVDMEGAKDDVEGQRVVDFFMGLGVEDFDVPVMAGDLEILGEVLQIDPAQILEHWSPEVEAGVRDACARNAALINELIAIGNAPAPKLGTWLANNLDANEFLMTYETADLLAVRGSANLLNLRAILYHKDGQDDEVLHTAATILKLGNHMSNAGHTLINEMMATALRKIAVQTVQRIADDAHFSEQRVREFGIELERAVRPEYLTRALEWERMGTLDVLWRLRPALAVSGDPWSRARAYLLRDYYATNYIRTMNAMVTATTVPAYEHKALLAQLKTARDDADASMGSYASMLLPNGMRALEQVINTEVMLRTAHIALAAALYQRDHGGYPDTLDALLPEYLEVLPDDPFSGKPYRYVHDEAGLRIYSVGVNYVDDGGIAKDTLDIGWGLLE